MPSTFHSLGWLRDYPDVRDLHIESTTVPSKLALAGQPSVSEMLAKIPTTPALSPNCNLSRWCPPIKDQGGIGSCTSNAAAALYEYFEIKNYGKSTSLSRLFLYKVTRQLSFLQGDSGAYLRTTMGALSTFGAPPEAYYPYIEANFDNDPDAFSFALAQSYQALTYYRVDPPGTTGSTLLTNIKTNISKGLPMIFGFTVFNSYSQTNTNGGCFVYPAPGDTISGGHAVMAMGYDDNKVIRNTNPGGIQTTGAIMIQNSWGTGWGQSGFGWIPYQYITSGMATDWWSLIKGEWVDLGVFT